ncbi:hypothetical protein M9H77_20898 [Catharanthus roseus]|uniref:Uncharacterized protein n=1 Tax=Catharanthus roseus TaxID=4058 RepID=A0ACC0AMH6_CATRO|nr:hypothetical protein M9H77_20898 [Catharanthus roseus]
MIIVIINGRADRVLELPYPTNLWHSYWVISSSLCIWAFLYSGTTYSTDWTFWVSDFFIFSCSSAHSWLTPPANPLTLLGSSSPSASRAPGKEQLVSPKSTTPVVCPTQDQTPTSNGSSIGSTISAQILNPLPPAPPPLELYKVRDLLIFSQNSPQGSSNPLKFSPNLHIKELIIIWTSN